MQATHVVVPQRERRALREFLFHLRAYLNRRVHWKARRHRLVGDLGVRQERRDGIRKRWCASLSVGKRRSPESSAVALQRQGDDPCRNAAVEESIAATHDRSLVREGRPGEADSRRYVVGVDRCELCRHALHVIAHSQVDIEIWAHPPFVDRLGTNVGGYLSLRRAAEILTECGVAVCLEGGERAERLGAPLVPGLCNHDSLIDRVSAELK